LKNIWQRKRRTANRGRLMPSFRASGSIENGIPVLDNNRSIA
jgi:hypothetical protein